MKTIEIDDELYSYIASNTKDIGESASQILRRLLMQDNVNASVPFQPTPSISPVANAEVDEQKQEITAQRPPQAKTLIVGPSDSSFIHTEPSTELTTLVSSQRFINTKTAIERFMVVLTHLYLVEPVNFARAIEAEANIKQKEKARTRLYFSNNPDILLASGKTTKPKQIPDTPYWVITNNNTNRKRQMVKRLMKQMEFSDNVIKSVCEAI